MKKLLVNIWNRTFDYYLIVRNACYLFVDMLYQKVVPAPRVVSIEETIRYIIDSHCSVSRLGDGEIKIANGQALTFQTKQPLLQQKMKEVLSTPIPHHIVCLPDIFTDLTSYNAETRRHWKLHLAFYRKLWYKYIHRKRIFYNAFISRCYMMFADKTSCASYFKLMQQIWAGKDILLVEGEKSRLGVGNDLFDNAHSIRRILAPNKNAFDHYEAIVHEIKKYSPQEYLILLALGPTATVMAYDLARKGYQAIDIGHVDIEYEWYRMGATHKVPVLGKFVNEAGAGAGVGDIHDEKYKKEIVCRF